MSDSAKKIFTEERRAKLAAGIKAMWADEAKVEAMKRKMSIAAKARCARKVAQN